MAVKRLSARRVATAALALCTATLLVFWHGHSRLSNISSSRPYEVATDTDTDTDAHAHPDSSSSSSSSAAAAAAAAPDLSSARAPFVAWPLRRLCAEQVASGDVVPGLVFLCDSNSGGPGNIRNYVLTCVRYAVEAGATGLQVPRIRARSAGDRADLFSAHEPLGYMFSEAHFRAAMADACPHISLFPADGDGDGGLEAIPGVAAKAARENVPPERMVRRVTPKHFGGLRAGCDERDPNRHTDRFGRAFRAWLAGLAADFDLPPASWRDPVLVRLSWGVLWDWPVLRDGPELAATFGGLLRIREDVLELADRVVGAMREVAASEAEKSRGGNGGGGGGGGDARFLGIHLRTEEDALSQWPTYENQSKGYIHRAQKEGFRGGVAYLASGSEKEIRRFSKDAQTQMDLKVMSKYGLVRGKELEKLKSLSWDQQALVDFAVLLESDYFVGVSPSSFSINIALKRHLQKEGLYTRQWRVGASDKRSWLVGRYYSYWDDWMFMFDGMWP